MGKTMLEYALEYARMGLPVFPVHIPLPNGGCSCKKGRDCQRIGKHPRTEHGLDDATADVSQISKWWERWPTANIGCAVGGASKILVLDVDLDRNKGKYGDETLAALEEAHGALPETWMCLTGGGGLHYYFLYDGEPLKNAVEFLPGLDIRTTGGYVVLPPSLHASGQTYEWEAAHEPADTALAQLPDWLRAEIARGSVQEKGTRFEKLETVAEGGRNRTMFRLAASLRARGLSEAAITAAVWEENQKRCAPPLERKEIETICASAGRYNRGGGVDRMQADAEAEEMVEAATAGDFEALTDDAVLSSALRMSDPVEREKRLAELRGRARELKRTREFDRILKAAKEALDAQIRQEAEACGEAGIVVPDCPLPGLKCFGWDVSKRGVVRTNGDREEACSHPIIITERLTNIDSGSERVKLAFYRDGKWKDLIVDKSTVASRQKIIELADAGVQVNSENAKSLIQFLHDLEAQNAYRIPRRRCVSRLGWAGNEFVPYVADVQYDGNPQYAAYFTAVSCAGDYEEWKRRVAALREQSAVARIALAASFASPLMWPLGAQVFFLHLWGGTEAGKSVCQMLAMSVWGNPDLGALLRSYNATYVGMERMAAFCHSIPLALDEQQTVRNNRYFSMDTLIYNLCEGQGKGRGTKSGSLENMATWRLCVLSSGEGPLASARSGGGSRNRTLEIYCKDKIFDDAAGVADFAKANYGHAGREYIAQISNPAVVKEAKERFSAYRKIISAWGRGTDKQAAAAAMLAVGDAYASMFVFGMEKEAAEASTVAFCNTLSGYLADMSEVSQVERAYRWVCGWIAANPDRFYHVGSMGDYRAGSGELWGKENDKKTGYLINQTIMDAAMEQAGFIVDACRKGFVEKGYVSPGKGRDTKQRRIGGGNGVWCYDFIVPRRDSNDLEDDYDPWGDGGKTIQFPGAQAQT